MIRLVIISALWCPSCLLMHRRYEQLKTDYPAYVVERLDYDLDRSKVKQFNIGKILPVLIVFKDDLEVGRLIGEKTSGELKKFMEGLML